MTSRRTAALSLVALLLPAGAASAATAQLFSYNVVATKSFTTSNHVEGTTFTNNLIVSNSPTFTGNVYVAGSVSGGNLHVNNGAQLITAAPLGGGVTVNNGTTATDATLGTTLTSLKQSIATYSSYFAAQTATGTVSTNGGDVTFTLPANSTGPVYFNVNLGASNIFNVSNLKFVFKNLSSSNSAIINIVSTAGTKTINPSNFNFEAQNNATASRVIWNFTNATSFTNNGGFYGTVLGPSLSFNTNGRNVYGGIYVDSLQQASGEIHLPLYAGTLPTPPATVIPLPTAALGGFALLSIAGIRRARRI